MEIMPGTVNNDVIFGGPADELIDGLQGDDTLVGQGGADTLEGGEGNDILAEGPADAGDDVLRGGPGNDGLFGGAGNDLLDGGEGSNTLTYLSATAGVTNDLAISGPQTIGGGMGVDTLLNFARLGGSAFNDTLLGDDGHTIFAGSPGDDYMDGRGGADAVFYGAATSGVTVDLSNTGPQTIGGGMGVDTLLNFKFIGGSNFGDYLRGDRLANGIVGNAGDDTIEGHGGADRLIGAAGNDHLDGGAGHDVARFTGSFTDYSFDVDSGGLVTVTDLRPGSPEGVDVLDRIEALEFAPLVFTESGDPEDAPDVPIGLIKLHALWSDAAEAGAPFAQSIVEAITDLIVTRSESLFSPEFMA
jgi:Ca2+-binding RTX toxin-like protein